MIRNDCASSAVALTTTCRKSDTPDFEFQKPADAEAICDLVGDAFGTLNLPEEPSFPEPASSRCDPIGLTTNADHGHANGSFAQT
jgi:hypothetical protein